MSRLDWIALAVACILLPAAVAVAGTEYTDGVAALTVAATGSNVETLIHLLQGIQYLLWTLIAEGVCLGIMVMIPNWRPK